MLAVTLVLPEAVLWGADLGLWGSARWRPLAYQYGAFWTGLLHGWRPNFPAQPVTMFLSYALLHVGPMHLLGNLAGLAWLGPTVARRAGAAGLAAVWIGSALGGAAAFGLMTAGAAPMVGASGALFGLAGAWVVQNWRADRRAGRSPRDAGQAVLVAVLLFVAVNVVSWLYEDGILAWQTHLGGALSGAALAMVWSWPRNENGRPKPPV